MELLLCLPRQASMWITREHDDEDNRGSRGEENVDITSKSPLHSVKLVARNIILPAPFRLRQKPSPRGNLGFCAMRYFLGTLNGICNFIFLACERVLNILRLVADNCWAVSTKIDRPACCVVERSFRSTLFLLRRKPCARAKSTTASQRPVI